MFIVASANDIAKLPPEFARAERFDGVFFLDLPGHDERQTTWSMYIRKFGLDPERIRRDLAFVYDAYGLSSNPADASAVAADGPKHQA